MKKTAIVSPLLMVVFSLVCASAALCAVPNTMNYQGRLTDNTGAGITGARSIVFSLYTVASGGEAFWTETQDVTLSDGRFSVVLGNTTPLDPKKITGETYIGVKVGDDAEMMPRQKFTSVPYALKSGDGIPVGVIVMWSGATGDIPEGWALCDGVDRTLPDGTKITPPNLIGQFVIGAGSETYPVGKTGGEAEHTLTKDEMPSHTHIQDAHSHQVRLENNRTTDTSSSGGEKTWNCYPYGYLQTDANAISNTTATNQNTGGGLPHNNLPPYYALCFIMKLY